MRELLDQEHAGARGGDRLDRRHEALHDDRSEAERELVDEQDARAGRRAPARARASAARRPRAAGRACASALSSSGKSSSARAQPVSSLATRQRVGRDSEVVARRERRQEAPALGDDGDPGCADPLRRAARSDPGRRAPPCPRSGAARRRPRARASTCRRRWRRAASSPRRAGSRRETSRTTVRPAAGYRQALDSQRGRGNLRRAHSSSSVPRYALITCSFRSTSAVGPGGDQLAEVEHRGRLAARRDQAHVVVDEDHERTELLGNPPDHVDEMQRLLVRQARRRLVEEHDSRLADHCPRDLDQPPLARAEPCHLGARRRLEPDELDRAQDRLAPVTCGSRRSARGSSPRCRRPTASRSPARSGRCAAGPSAPVGSRPS